LRAALRSLLDDGAIVRDRFVLRRPMHVAQLTPADRARLERLLAALGASGQRPPSLGDLAATLAEPRLGLVDELAAWARRGHLVQVADNRYVAPERVLEWIDIARGLDAEGNGTGFDAAAYRDRSGLGRNLTIDVLEFLDRQGVTRYRAGRRRLVATLPC
ncbi:MAG: SelB C-terminal domain-containing protein, partial [Caldimonas sp.]